MTTSSYYTFDKSQRMTSVKRLPAPGAGDLGFTNFTYNQRNLVTNIAQLNRDLSPIETDRSFSYNGMGERVFGYDGYTGTSYWAWDGPRLTSDNFNRLGLGYGSNKYRWDDRQLLEIGAYSGFDGAAVQYPDLDSNGSVKHLALSGESYEANAKLVRLGAAEGSLGNRLQAGADHFARLRVASQEMYAPGQGPIFMSANASFTFDVFRPWTWPMVPPFNTFMGFWSGLPDNNKNIIFRLTRLDCPSRNDLDEPLTFNGGIWLLTADSWAGTSFVPHVVSQNCQYFKGGPPTAAGRPAASSTEGNCVSL